MVARFDLRDLYHGLTDGLRKRREQDEHEPPDVAARVLLVAVPILVGVSAGLVGPLEVGDALLAGVALLIGALIAGFTQVAAWKDRLQARGRATDAVAIRSLNEAAAHILIAVVASVFGTATAIVSMASSSIECPPLWLIVLTRIVVGLSAASFAYIALTLVIVVVLLWDSFMRPEEEKNEKR